MDYLPLYANLHDRPVLIVGAGDVALRKAELLLRVGAIVYLVAPQLTPRLQHYVDQAIIHWRDKIFAPAQLDDVYLVIAATNQHELNQRIYQEACLRNILINTVDDPAHCSFILPAIVDRSPVIVAISSGGRSPVLIRLLRERLETLLPHSLAQSAKIAEQWRTRVKQRFSQLSDRRRFWETLFQGRFSQLIEQNQPQQAEQWLAKQLQQSEPFSGYVSLVGAGPGDPELLTLKALRLIQQADVVLYDALISEEILNLVRREAKKVFVGKRALQHSIRQEQINQWLIEYARQGLQVVRLKSGDPFIFGRGGEELQALKQANIPYQVVPGITAAIGAAAYSAIPLTHRELAHSTTFITGYHSQLTADINWPVLAQSNHTLVIYMGMIHAGELTEQLIAHGRAPQTPVAIISKATQPEQQTLTGTLTELTTLSQSVPTPALIIIGEVVSLHGYLAWFGEQPEHD